MTTTQHDPDLFDDLREVSGVLGCGYPVVPPARDAADAAPAADLALLAAVLEGYEEYGS